jgi:hypothetical protein
MSGKITLLKEAQVEVHEAEIQKAFESNLGLIEDGLQYVESFVRIGNGVIDTLAIDDNLRPVIIEFKKPDASDRDALVQALDYYVWCKENLDWLEEYIRKFKPSLLPADKNLSDEIRLIVVAGDFEDRVKRIALAIEPEIKLISYNFFEKGSNEVSLGYRVVLDSSEAEITAPEIPPTISEHFDEKPDFRPVFDKLVARIKELVDPEIDVEKSKNIKSAKYSIIFKHKINYIYLNFRRDHLRLTILGLASEPPNKRIIPITAAWAQKQKWGDVKVSKPEDIDDELMTWIKNAYNRAA